MSERAVTVVDTNVLLNLATPVVDGRPQAPSGADPLKALLTVYDVHTPASVLGEVTNATGDDDLIAACRHRAPGSPPSDVARYRRSSRRTPRLRTRSRRIRLYLAGQRVGGRPLHHGRIQYDQLPVHQSRTRRPEYSLHHTTHTLHTGNSRDSARGIHRCCAHLLRRDERLGCAVCSAVATTIS